MDKVKIMRKVSGGETGGKEVQYDGFGEVIEEIQYDDFGDVIKKKEDIGKSKVKKEKEELKMNETSGGALEFNSFPAFRTQKTMIAGKKINKFSLLPNEITQKSSVK